MHLMNFDNHGVYSPDGKVDMTPEQAARINADTTIRELVYWQTQPSDMMAYYDTSKGIVTTWTGATLGTIMSSRVYRHNFGGQFIALGVEGTNGAMYHGRASYDHGTVIRLRKAR